MHACVCACLVRPVMSRELFNIRVVAGRGENEGTSHYGHVCKLKADRPHLRYYAYMPPDYRQTP